MLEFLKSLGNFILDLIETIVTGLLIFAVFYLFLFQPHQVRGNSMLPNFDDAEKLLTNKLTYRLKTPERGQVIIFKAPQNIKYDYIKRIIGLPLEKVSLRDGRIYINDLLLDESSYLAPETITRGNSFLPEGGLVDIPENQYFVLGDNRAHSSDSREWGFVPKENIVGKAWLCYWPLAKFGLIPSKTR